MKKENPDLGERGAASFVMLLASFTTFLILWLIISYFIVRATHDSYFSFNVVIYTTGVFTVISFFLPNTTLNIMSYIWKKMEALINALLHG